jgi:hypothetical protein
MNTSFRLTIACACLFVPFFLRQLWQHICNDDKVLGLIAPRPCNRSKLGKFHLPLLGIIHLAMTVNQARLLSASLGKARRTKKASLQTTLLPVVIKPASGDRLSTNAGVAAAGIEVLLPKGTIRLQSIDTGMLRTLVGLLA